MRRLILIAVALSVMAFLLAACGEDKIVTVEVEKEVIKEVQVPGETIVVEKEVIIEIEVPGETVVVEKVVIKEVEVPGETVVVEKVVIKEVEVPGETIVVEKEIVVEKVVEVPGEIVVVEKEIVVERVVEVTKPLSGQLAQEAARYGGTLRQISRGRAASLDRIFDTNVGGSIPARHIYEGIFSWDMTLGGSPALADKWTITPDGLTYIIELRQGVTFHDGRLMTSTDVIASLNRWHTANAGGKLVNDFLDGGIETGLTAVDDNTIQFKFAEPFGELFNALSGEPRSAYIYTEKAASFPTSEDFGEELAIGTGAYQLDVWERGNKIILARYEDYVRRDDPPNNYAGGKKAYLDRIEFVDVPATETKLALLRTGAIDVLPTFPLDFYDSFKDNPTIVLMPDFGFIPTMDFDTTQAPSSNIEIRRAILAAVDVVSIMNAVAPRELWILCSSRYVCGTQWESSAGAEGLYNQANMPLAQQMLTDSGYADETFVFWAPTELDILRQTGQVIGPMLEEIGFNLEWPSMDWATITARFNEGVWHAHNDYWGVGYRGTPMRDSVLAGNMDGEPFNQEPGPSLQTAFFKAVTVQERQEIVDDINRFFWEFLPSISFGQIQLYQAVLSDVRDVQVAAGLNYTSAWLDR